MLPDAPGLLSMTTGWPSALDSGSAMVRAAMSGVEPPGKPTRMRTGLVGQACAKALAGASSAHAAAAASAERRRVRLLLAMSVVEGIVVLVDEKVSVKGDVAPLHQLAIDLGLGFGVARDLFRGPGQRLEREGIEAGADLGVGDYFGDIGVDFRLD